jgi:dTDP-4-amino-4,6-dideoxygalactose transaminase
LDESGPSGQIEGKVFPLSEGKLGVCFTQGADVIPITQVKFGKDVEEEVLSVIRSGMIAQGPKVAELETKFAELNGSKHVIAVNNGTTALIAALSVLDLGPEDEVVTSPFTFVATLNAALAAGAKVRFADIEIDDFCLSERTIEPVVNENTKVLMPVHLYGQCADMAPIASIATRVGAHIVEDAAQSHLASVSGVNAGNWGVGCFSLYATKNLTSGEGGLITTEVDEIADRLRVLRNQGMRQRYQYEMAGNNFRMTDLQAAVCVPQLRNYETVIETRTKNAATLTSLLSDIDWLILPSTNPNRRHVWHQYTVVLRDDAKISRKQLLSHLDKSGIGAGIYYPRLVHDYDCYRSDPRVIVDPTPMAAYVAQNCVSLPVHQFLSERDLEQIADAVRAAVS